MDPFSFVPRMRKRKTEEKDEEEEEEGDEDWWNASSKEARRRVQAARKIKKAAARVKQPVLDVTTSEVVATSTTAALLPSRTPESKASVAASDSGLSDIPPDGLRDGLGGCLDNGVGGTLAWSINRIQLGATNKHLHDISI